MKLQIQILTLPLARPFTISRGTITDQRTVVVQLQWDGHVGYGEVSEDAYYGHSAESIVSSIQDVRQQVEALNLAAGSSLWAELHGQLKHDSFALSALDMASHDLYAKTVNRRCFELWGLEWNQVPVSCLTLSIGSPEEVVEEFQQNPDWQIYKLKLGSTHDLETVRAVRAQTDAVLRVDANCAWSAEEAISNSKVLQDLGVEFLEQPLPADAPMSEHAQVFRESAIPVIADECCCIPADVRACAECFHGINIKLCKCGGLTPALQMLKEAKSLGLLTMVGCMIESSIGISASAQLLPLLDFCDLDGAVLLASDPAEGVTVERGVVTLSARSGSGCWMDNSRSR